MRSIVYREARPPGDRHGMSTPCYVYILTNQSGCYYVGMTNNIERRWHEHVRRERGAKFTREYHVTRLVYLVRCPDRRAAGAHERSLKRRTRARKLAAIRAFNPSLQDLAVTFGWRKAPASARSTPPSRKA
jgi:putative endonuclease